MNMGAELNNGTIGNIPRSAHTNAEVNQPPLIKG